MNKKKILITGLSRGIGYAIGKQFLNANYQVIGCASSVDAVETFKKSNLNMEIYCVNLANKKETIDFGNMITQKYDTIDILVNNAGRYIPGQIVEEEDGVFENMLNTNVASAYHLTRTIIPKMIKQRSGTVINVCSTAGIIAYPNGASYSISKFAMYGMTKVLREELKPYGIRVIALSPGATQTDSWNGVDIPSDRLMTPQDIAILAFAAVEVSNRTVVEDIICRPQAGDII